MTKPKNWLLPGASPVDEVKVGLLMLAVWFLGRVPWDGTTYWGMLFILMDCVWVGLAIWLFIRGACRDIEEER